MRRFSHSDQTNHSYSKAALLAVILNIVVVIVVVAVIVVVFIVVVFFIVVVTGVSGYVGVCEQCWC